jgi:hypothetical protein
MLVGALLVPGCLTTPGLAQPGGSQPPPGYLKLGKPDQDEGRRILEEFRRQGIAGDYYLAFELRVLPRRGEERVLHGSMWGSRNPDGPISRVQVQADQPGAAESRLLIQNGPKPALWEVAAPPGGAIEQLGVAALFSPVAGTNLTPFDLQMPFLYWSDFVYEGLTRMHGRPTHQFLLRPPADFVAQHPELSGVRVYLDTQYVAMVQAELLGAGGRILKVVNLLDLKKVGDQWLVKAIDVRDEVSRDKTRFLVMAAALNQQFPASVFEPAELAAPATVPPNLISLSAP